MSADVTMPDGSIHTVRKLLTDYAKPVKITEKYAREHPGWANWWLNRGNSGGNTKQSRGKEYISVGLSLAPNKISGYNVCAKTTPGCTAACVFNGGLVTAFSQIKPAQIARTRLLFQNRKVFDEMLLAELTKYAQKFPDNLVCRLNVYSDLPWERLTPWLFEKLPNVIFYDYTKILPRMMSFIRKDFPKNYHLTFSRSESNEAECHEVLNAGGNVTVVFPKHQEPKTFWGYNVINGDANDLRFTDPTTPCIISLYAKNKFGRSDQTGFVVRNTVSLPVIQSTEVTSSAV